MALIDNERALKSQDLTTEISQATTLNDATIGLTRRRAVAAAALTLCSPSWSQNSATQTRIIRLGQSLSLSGEHSVLSASYRDAVTAAFIDVNRFERTTGVRYELTTMDDQGLTELTAENTKTLIESVKVHALFGYCGPGADRVGAQSAALAGVPYVAPVSGSVELRSPLRPGTFVFRASVADEIRYIVNHAKQIGLTRLALVYELSFLGLEMRNSMLEALDAARRADLVLSIIDATGSAYTVPGAVAAVLAINPQAIVLGSNDVASAAYVRAARGSGYGGLFYTLSNVGSQGLARRLGPMVSGIAVTQVIPFPLGSSLKVSRDHRAFCVRHGFEPTFHTMEGWLGVLLFHEAMKTLKGSGPTEIAKALRAAPEKDFGNFSSRWFESTTNSTARVSLTAYDREGRLRG
jgi:branched-chain amino acid transport system substrate-binding protein